ncbi:glutamate decarboxylase [Lasiosphaeria miniovina]|uniref:Glutamate decarboxylase n=1 Tax=Lasiosphaeria miniovina TaxID=1954250 RepID=A0AA39ZTQ5_9PEZI|nr:glutamate decarboxylase [Lasiosphaeria miniovina]KAK0703502.1 glutamate decarboxylase [Lasiosphaeria miniovina]
MVLSRHVDPEEVVSHLQGARTSNNKTKLSHLTPYDTPYASQVEIPKYRLPDDGAPADTVYAMIRDELDLDGRPNLNLASFVNTYVDDNSQKIMAENVAKNLADNDEYPAMLAMSQRCVSILANLWRVNKGENAIGSPTVGSSEAIHLGGLAMKRRWQERRWAEGKDAYKPNILMGSNAQVALEKFARYFDVEARILPVSAKSNFCLDPDLVRQNIDENTIGVFAILGSTYTGHYEPVEEVSRILDEFQNMTGIDIPIHVDAASGGFVAPFTHAGAGQRWNFELPRVKSINTSGHKFGLSCAGVGWIIWRDESYLPQHLIFKLHYLGGTEESYTLNFSRPGAQVIVQYYNLIHLGFSGYREIMENCLVNARLLSNSLEATKWYTCVSAIHRCTEAAPAGVAQKVKNTVESTVSGGGKEQQQQDGNGETSAAYVAGLPVVSFRLTDEFKREFAHIKQETVSLLLRARGWIIPNYALPPGEDGTEILRVVVRESMSFDLLDRLVTDIVQVTEKLIDNDEVDLSILHKQRKEPAAKTDSGKKAQGGVAKDAEQRALNVGKNASRMAEGIHRSVC